MIPSRFLAASRRQNEPSPAAENRRTSSPGAESVKSTTTARSLFRRDKANNSAKLSDRDFLGSSALVDETPHGLAARLKLPMLSRSKSDNDLQARRALQQQLRRAEQAPALPPLQLDLVRHATQGAQRPDTLRQPSPLPGLTLPRSPRTPTLASTRAETLAARPYLSERSTTGDIPQHTQTRPVRSTPFPSPPTAAERFAQQGRGSPYERGFLQDAAYSRPSTAGSSKEASSLAETRSTLVTSPSISSLDGRSGISDLSASSYLAATSRRQNEQYRAAYAAQAGFAQDSLLRSMHLAALSTSPIRPRRLSDVLLGGLVPQVFAILARVFVIPPAVMQQLQDRSQNLWDTRSMHACDASTVQVQVELRRVLDRFQKAAAEDFQRRPRRAIERRDVAEASILQQYENDLARFLCDVLGLPELLGFYRFALTPETCDALRANSRALPTRELEGLLRALTLDEAQRVDLSRYVEQSKQLHALLRPQASLDSISTGAHSSLGAPF